MAGLTSILNVLVPVQEKKEGYEAKVSACSFLLLSGPAQARFHVPWAASKPW